MSGAGSRPRLHGRAFWGLRPRPGRPGQPCPTPAAARDRDLQFHSRQSRPNPVAARRAARPGRPGLQSLRSRLPWLAGALAGPAFLTYVNNQYSTFMPYVKNDPALSPISALPSSRSHHIPHPMPGRGQAEGRGGSPSRQGRAKCRAERRAPPLNAGWREKRNGAGKPLTSGPDGKQNGMGTSPRSMPRRYRSWPGETPGGTERPAASGPDGEKKKRRSRSGPDATPGEKHIDAGRGKCGTGRVFLSYQSRARTADGAGMEARPPGRSVERLAAAQA